MLRRKHTIITSPRLETPGSWRKNGTRSEVTVSLKPGKQMTIGRFVLGSNEQIPILGITNAGSQQFDVAHFQPQLVEDQKVPSRFFGRAFSYKIDEPTVCLSPERCVSVLNRILLGPSVGDTALYGSTSFDDQMITEFGHITPLEEGTLHIGMPKIPFGGIGTLAINVQ